MCERNRGDLFSINSHEEFMSVLGFFLANWKSQIYTSLIMIGLFWKDKVQKLSVFLFNSLSCSGIYTKGNFVHVK